MDASEKNIRHVPYAYHPSILHRTALHRTGDNTPPYNSASGIYWRQRIPSFKPYHKSIMETINYADINDKDQLLNID